MRKLLVLWLLWLTSIAAFGQVPPVNAPDPGTPVTTMRSGFIYVDNNTFPKRRPGVDYEMIDLVTSNAGSYLPGRWPGLNPGEFDLGITGRNGGAFRIFAARSHFAYDDPIIYPGQKGKSHLHVFFGNTSTSGVSTAYTILNKGNSTSAGGTANRSAYWVPAVIYVCDTPEKIAGTGTPGGLTCDPKRNGEVVDPESLNIYYKGTFGVGESDTMSTGSTWAETHDNEALPPAFRMIAGDPNRTTPPVIGDMGWACTVTDLNEPFYRMIPGSGMVGQANAATSHAAFAACNGGSGPIAGRIVQRVAFPACRNNAGDLDSPSHNAHVAYKVTDPPDGSGVPGQFRCPTGFDHPMPGVTYHVIYPGGAKIVDWPFWRLASDHYSTLEPSGFSNHGDWFNGWKQDVMQEWTHNCDVRNLDCHDGVLGQHPPKLTDADFSSGVCNPSLTTCTWRFLRFPSFRQP